MRTSPPRSGTGRSSWSAMPHIRCRRSMGRACVPVCATPRICRGNWPRCRPGSSMPPCSIPTTRSAARTPPTKVEHAVDAGMLIEAIAHDGAAALESGYGQRPFPKLAGSAFAGDHPAVGAVFPAPLGRPEPFGDGWRVLWAGACGDVPELWRDLGAEVTTDAGDSSPGLLANAQVVVVRPDRYVVAVANDLADVTERIGAWRRGATA